LIRLLCSIDAFGRLRTSSFVASGRFRLPTISLRCIAGVFLNTFP
jgi:hypothetical protein